MSRFAIRLIISSRRRFKHDQPGYDGQPQGKPGKAQRSKSSFRIAAEVAKAAGNRPVLRGQQQRHQQLGTKPRVRPPLGRLSHGQPQSPDQQNSRRSDFLVVTPNAFQKGLLRLRSRLGAERIDQPGRDQHSRGEKQHADQVNPLENKISHGQDSWLNFMASFYDIRAKKAIPLSRDRRP